jgi:hypothetical protein
MPKCVRCGIDLGDKCRGRIRCKTCQPSSRRLRVIRRWELDRNRHLYYINEVYFGCVKREGCSYRCYVDGLMTLYFGPLRGVRDPTSHRVSRIDIGGFQTLDAAKKYMGLLSYKSKWRGKYCLCPCGRIFSQGGLGRPRVKCYVCHPSRSQTLKW